jgi:hypothetical protein
LQHFFAARRKKVLAPQPHGFNSVVEDFVEGFVEEFWGEIAC